MSGAESGCGRLYGHPGQYEGIQGSGASFHFPRISDVKASRQGADTDYGARSYDIDTKQEPKGIRHGSGPLWSFGTPSVKRKGLSCV